MELNFKKNLGDGDRSIRVVVGLFLVGLAISQYASGGWAIVAVIFALTQFVEACLGY